MRKVLAAVITAAFTFSLAGAAPAAAPVAMHYHGHHTPPLAGAAMHFYG